MKTKFLFYAVAFSALSYLTSCDKIHHGYCSEGDQGKISVKVYAAGLNNPRGLKFGPDGNLYVAEGGVGGTNSTAGQCDQVPPPVGPYTGSVTGARISMITSNGRRTQVSGVSDVAFIGNQLYALLAGAGCSHGVPSIPNGVIKVTTNGGWYSIANLSSWLQSHPAANTEEDDFEPDGTPYSMVNAWGDFYAVEPNHGQLIKITKSGDISQVADISASQGHIVPTAITVHNGNFIVGNLNTFPHVDGSSNIYKITPNGQVSVWASGFSTVLGVAFDDEDRLYVLQNFTGNPFPTPGTGNVVRVNPSGSRDTIVSGLNLPTAITFGNDGKLYISNWGYGPPAIGGGQVLQVTLKDCENKDLNAIISGK